MKTNYLYIDTVESNDLFFCTRCACDLDNSEDFERAILAQETNCSLCGKTARSTKSLLRLLSKSEYPFDIELSKTIKKAIKQQDRYFTVNHLLNM